MKKKRKIIFFSLKYRSIKSKIKEKQGKMRRYRRKSVSFLMLKNMELRPTNCRKNETRYDRKCGWNFELVLIE